MNTQLTLGSEIDLNAAGLVRCAVPEGTGDKELDRVTGGERCDTVAFFENGVTYFLFAAGGHPPLPNVGTITFTTTGMVTLPDEADWLMGHEPAHVSVGALPTWATDPEYRPPVPKPTPPPPRAKTNASTVKISPIPAPVSPRVEVSKYQQFPTDALPDMLRRLVEEVAASVGCDPAFVALPALAVVGAAIGNSVVVSPKHGFREPPLLWCVTVGDSGTGKSPALRPVSDAANGIETGLHASAGEAADRERFVLQDVTFEKLVEVTADSPRGVLVLVDELACWLDGFTRYRSSGSDLNRWLPLHDAASVGTDRKGGERKSVYSPRAFVAVTGGIQPDVLRRAFVGSPVFVTSGLAARMLFAYPPKRCPKWSDKSVSQKAETDFAGVLNRLRSIPFDKTRGPVVVSLEPAALARFKKLNNEFAQRGEVYDGGPMPPVLSKAPRMALRLALIHHCAGRGDRGAISADEVLTDASMRAGEKLARWFVAEAERVYSMFGESQTDREVQQVVGWVRRRGGTCTPRDLQKPHSRKYTTARAAEQALDAVVSAGFGVWRERTPVGGGHTVREFVLIEQTADTRP